MGAEFFKSIDTHVYIDNIYIHINMIIIMYTCIGARFFTHINCLFLFDVSCYRLLEI